MKKVNIVQDENIIKNFSDLEVWFLVGSQDLYGKETLEQVAIQSENITKQLQELLSVNIKIRLKPTLKSSDAIKNTIIQANSDKNVIGLITWMHTFSPAKMWIRGLQLLQKPLLHLHTQNNVRLPYESIDFDFMNLNQSAHGDREFAYILSRLNISRKTVVGHVSDTRVTEEISSWIRASLAWHDMQDVNVVRFGDNMRNVAVTEGDKTESEILYGTSINTWSINDLCAEIDKVSASDIDEKVSEYLLSYNAMSTLKKDGIKHKSLRDAASIEIGLENILKTLNAKAFTTNFEDLGKLKQLPGISVQRLMQKGYGFGAEGDWKTAILVRLAKVMAVGLPGGASLMEDYTYDLTPGDEKILGSHMLEICPSITQETPSLEIHPLAIGGKEDPVRLVFNASAGDGIVIAMSDFKNRFRIIANKVKLETIEQGLPKLPIARALWKPMPDFITSTSAWLESGAAHHTVLSTSISSGMLADFAAIANTELVMIDEETNLKTLKQQLNLEKTTRK